MKGSAVSGVARFLRRVARVGKARSYDERGAAAPGHDIEQIRINEQLWLRQQIPPQGGNGGYGF